MWDDARQLNAIAVTLMLIAIAFLAWAAVGWVTRLSAFGYREVVVTTPLARTSGAHLEAVIRGELRGTFFTMDLDAARASLSRVPWVRAVALRRQWPRRLEIGRRASSRSRAGTTARRQHARRSVHGELGRRAAGVQRAGRAGESDG
jgi:hypothetical protein